MLYGTHVFDHWFQRRRLTLVKIKALVFEELSFKVDDNEGCRTLTDPSSSFFNKALNALQNFNHVCAPRNTFSHINSRQAYDTEIINPLDVNC